MRCSSCVSIRSVWSCGGRLFPFFMHVGIQPFQISRQRGCGSNNSEWLSQVARSCFSSVQLGSQQLSRWCVLKQAGSSVNSGSAPLAHECRCCCWIHWCFTGHCQTLNWGASFPFFQLLLQCCCCQRLFSGIHCWCKSTNRLWHFNQERKKNRGVAGMCTEWEFEVDKLYCGWKKRGNTQKLRVWQEVDHWQMCSSKAGVSFLGGWTDFQMQFT